LSINFPILSDKSNTSIIAINIKIDLFILHSFLLLICIVFPAGFFVLQPLKNKTLVASVNSKKDVSGDACEKTGKKIGSIVDIGCGNGYLLDRASGLFLFRAGSDMSKSAVKNASCVCDTVVRGGPDELLAQGLHGFDLLTLISVLEHIYNPVDFMNKCRMLVKKGGCIAVAVPCYGSFWRKIMGRRWISFKLPEHIAYYEKKSLIVLGEKAGLKLVKFLPYHHFFPLSVILDKLGLHCSTVENSCLGNMNIFLPSVMLAAVFEN
jgi:SAM-dependent methyltransferase